MIVRIGYHTQILLHAAIFIYAILWAEFLQCSKILFQVSFTYVFHFWPRVYLGLQLRPGLCPGPWPRPATRPGPWPAAPHPLLGRCPLSGPWVLSRATPNHPIVFVFDRRNLLPRSLELLICCEWKGPSWKKVLTPLWHSIMCNTVTKPENLPREFFDLGHAFYAFNDVNCNFYGLLRR